MVNQAELLWKRIIEKGLNVETGFKEKLNLQPGAREEDFQLIETALGVTLPEEMKSFYRVYNGQNWASEFECFVRNLTLSPISEIIDNWKFIQEEFDPDEFDDDLAADIGTELKPVLWNPKWIPIAENGGGDYLCIDTDPSEAGSAGQILYFWHDWGDRSIEAKSLFEFIEICLEEEN
ncbi:SMI1/KNR4 family protein [Metabacillus fastidiosus]|uniref:SMI1/KNR4 family protein n=1 Tax=Metabacillus fastidiosus TaxID=1458 RepID=UPI002DB8D3E8|nr:SMI1/KNR4 family protein [Metabacillus fastidiosus]MEC2074778.1 SMI1/KNR4 family protein [Metabacillus fastidiosus]